MPDLSLADVKSIYAWATIWVQRAESAFIVDANLQIDVFGNGDDAYLVIDRYTGENSLVEYQFFTLDPEAKPKSMMLIFDFLKTVDFDLEKLMHFLESATFDETEAGPILEIMQLRIYRSVLGQ